jgi:hypothetical protein
MNKKEPITKALLYISGKSAAYGSEALHQALNSTGIQTNPLDLVVPITTEPSIEGFPSYLPAKELAYCQTGTQIPYLIDKKEIILTCTDTKENLSFQKNYQQCLTAFNEEPNFAFYKNQSIENRQLKDFLLEKGLTTNVIVYQTSRIKMVTSIHNNVQFKPTKQKHPHKLVRQRQITGSRPFLKE